MKVRWRKRFAMGTMHRALVIRAKVNFCRLPGIYIKFNENAVVLVNKKVVPVSNRVYGPILKELCIKWPSLGCVSRVVI
jgi:ribosomal protein L14